MQRAQEQSPAGICVVSGAWCQKRRVSQHELLQTISGKAPQSDDTTALQSPPRAIPPAITSLTSALRTQALPLMAPEAAADEEAGQKELCAAKGYPCFLNCLCAPFVLCYQSHKIYCCACFFTYVYRLLVSVCCCICRSMCPSCYRYTDKAFPATAKSIGAWKDKSEADVGKEIEWQRAVAYFESKLTAEQSKEGVRVKLFEDGVEPKDVAQGGLGDCWLISALACMSEHEGLLRTIFKTQEFNPTPTLTLTLTRTRTRTRTRTPNPTPDPNPNAGVQRARQVLGPAVRRTREEVDGGDGRRQPAAAQGFDLAAVRAAQGPGAVGGADREGLCQVLRQLRLARRRQRDLGIRGADGRPRALPAAQAGGGLDPPRPRAYGGGHPQDWVSPRIDLLSLSLALALAPGSNPKPTVEAEA